jgi:hypothetical protein
VTADPNVPQDTTTPSSLATTPAVPGVARPATALRAPLENLNVRRMSAFDRWLYRFTMLMFVFVCAVVGVLLVILPWRPEWTDNHFLMVSPTLRAVVSNGFVRGLCSGLGVLDIWIGFWEAVHYHEDSRP